jgi:hypothetical protein
VPSFVSPIVTSSTPSRHKSAIISPVTLLEVFKASYSVISNV